MSQPPPAKRQKLTPLAEKYGHPSTGPPDPSALQRIVPFKSGLTPLDAGPFTTAEERTTFLALENYQRKRFAGDILPNAFFLAAADRKRFHRG